MSAGRGHDPPTSVSRPLADLTAMIVFGRTAMLPVPELEA